MTAIPRNPIVDRCEALHYEGYTIGAVTISRADQGQLRVAISRPSYLPLGEGGDLPHHRVRVDLRDLPPGVSVSGFDRCEDDVLELPGSEEQAEALIIQVAAAGEAQDWHRFDGDTPDYPHWLTKPNKWR